MYVCLLLPFLREAKHSSIFIVLDNVNGGWGTELSIFIVIFLFVVVVVSDFSGGSVVLGIDDG